MSSFPLLSFKNINDIELVDKPVVDIEVVTNGINLQCRLNRQSPNDYLIVAPNGAVDREKLSIPAFARWNWHGIFGAYILAISDPMLYYSDSLQIGWFASTKYIDVTSYTADVVKKIADELNISHERIIFWGSSAGGYSSILLASKIILRNLGRFLILVKQLKAWQFSIPANGQQSLPCRNL